MIIDIYDPGYMERPREERFGELKSLLSHDIMSVKKVYVQWQRTVIELKLKADWVGIERIVEIHKMLETLYPQITPFSRKNCVLNDGSLELDNSYDNRYIPHYKTVKQKGKSRNRHQEGEQYLKSDGEVYVMRLYEYEGSLYEQYTEDAYDFDPALGDPVCAAGSFSPALEDGMLTVEMTDDAGNTCAVRVALRAGGAM